MVNDWAGDSETEDPPTDGELRNGAKHWLENAEKRIEAKEEDNKRRLAAAKALTEGGTWKWNPTGNPKDKQERAKRTEEPVMRNPWTPNTHDSEQPRPQKRKTTRAQKKTKKSKGKDGDTTTTTVHSPWDLRPMAARAGSIASAGAAPPVSNQDTGAAAAAAAAATARAGTSTAHISLEPSEDPQRRDRDGAPKTRTPRTSATPTQDPPRFGTPTEPTTPGQDDDPERIDDVV